MKPSVGLVVMAAGRASRYGKNKLLEQVLGKPMIAHILEAIPYAAFDGAVLVSSSDEILRMGEDYGFSTIKNDAPEDGISKTIHLGLSALASLDGVMFLVSDQPCLKRDTLEALLYTFCHHPDAIVAPCSNGRRGNPCIFPKSFFKELMNLQGDNGGNIVIKAHEDCLCLVEVSPLELFDVDTPEALHQLNQITS